ncbi:multicopper oxidase domain-containing protein [Zhihengliuella sp.]|uniref:multicopper oxidase domain-containing protein n=1 Tax=Zhihengliuella sp. TaxID=1954483 RepID=UPI0035C008A4
MRVDKVVQVSSTEVWEVRSTNPFPHNFHVHDVQFRVASIDGAAPPDPGLRAGAQPLAGAGQPRSTSRPSASTRRRSQARATVSL